MLVTSRGEQWNMDNYDYSAGAAVNNGLQSDSCLKGTAPAVPQWDVGLSASTLAIITLFTIVGNVLVILSVFTHRPLRIVQNFFIVSLALADLAIAVLVMPLSIAKGVVGRWVFGIHVCKMWLTCDVLCCTASILNLCAIALDRYWAITNPIKYAQKRTLKRVLLIILGVWLVSAIISSPPLAGWNDWPDQFKNDTDCELARTQGYVIYSSLGSFYIPLFIMSFVYMEIFIATKRRLQGRVWATRLKSGSLARSAPPAKFGYQPDQESVSSETSPNENPPLGGATKAKKKNSNAGKIEKEKGMIPILEAEDTLKDGRGARRSSEPLSTDSRTPRKPPPLGKLRSCRVLTTSARRAVSTNQFIEEKQRISLSKERRAARTLGIIMGAFVVCWLPFFLMYVIIPFCPKCCPSDKLINFITWLGYINSTLNPIIYTIFNLDFRRAFKKLLHIRP